MRDTALMPALNIHEAGPGLTVQDIGRPGWLAQGLPTGGAADQLALVEAAALLQAPLDHAAIEMMGTGGVFTVDDDTRICLTGAHMQATIDGHVIDQNCTYRLAAGAKLIIRGARSGVYGYLSFAGGIRTPHIMQSRAAHLTAGIGRLLTKGDTLPVGPDNDPMKTAERLTVDDRSRGGPIRIMAGPQTDFFDIAARDTFTSTTFRRSPQGNRQGIRLENSKGKINADRGGLNNVSDLIVPGDIQIAGNGVPYVLLAECQTIGGYPRIGTVIPVDLPKIAQTAPGVSLQFQFLDTQQADATAISHQKLLEKYKQLCQPMTRDPHDISDLLRYQLISGATRGDDLERP